MVCRSLDRVQIRKPMTGDGIVAAAAIRFHLKAIP
jgi:hypothetical protein